MKRVFFCLWMAFFILFSIGCELADQETQIHVSWPKNPSWAVETQGIVSWSLMWYASDGSVLYRTVTNPEGATLKVQKELPIIIAAHPETGLNAKPWRCLPAGAVIPIDQVRKNSVQLSWNDGFAAEYLIDLAGKGLDPWRVNIDRFVETAISRSEGNPWNLNRLWLSSDLVAGKLNVYSFRNRPIHKVDIMIPSGTWYSTYPPDAKMLVYGDGWTGSLAEGLHYFLNPVRRMVATVSVSKDSVTQLLLDLPVD